MTEDFIRDMADLMKLFSDPSRLKILLLLRQGEQKVGEVAKQLGLSSSGVSHQLAQLRAGRLVKYRREGKVIHYSLDDEHVEKLIDMAIDHLKHR